MVSWAFMAVCFAIFQNWDAGTGGRDGFYGIPVMTFLGVEVNSFQSRYYFALFCFLVALLITSRLARSFAGRAMLAVRFDEDSAAMMGISPGYFKILAMTVSSGIGGMVGAALVAVNAVIAPNTFNFLASFNIALFAIVAGRTNLFRAAMTAIILTFIVEYFRIPTWGYLINGSVLIIAVFLQSGVWTLQRDEQSRRTPRADVRAEAS
jgi:branched-chain amino acid transport system permease protein